MAGAAETLAEHRERKRIAADEYAKAQRDLVRARFEKEVLPNMVRVFDATCVGIDTTNKTITIKFDPVRPDLEFLGLNTALHKIGWDRSKLQAAAVVNHRLKVLLTIRNGMMTMTLGAITSG